MERAEACTRRHRPPSGRLLIEKMIFTQEEFLEMVKVVNKEMKTRKTETL